jgi:hypothetical protein
MVSIDSRATPLYLFQRQNWLSELGESWTSVKNSREWRTYIVNRFVKKHI